MAITAEPYNHSAWDDTPHQLLAGVPVESIRLADILAGGTLQVQGVATAEHRGKPAYRLDVENLMTGGKGRLVLTAGQEIGDVKRYTDRTSPSPARTNAPATTSESPTNGWTGFGLASRAWVRAMGDGSTDAYDDDTDAMLFAFACAAVDEYATRTAAGSSLYQSLRHTLEAIGENLLDQELIATGRLEDRTAR